MQTVYERELANARQIERNILRGAARICSGSFGRVCKALWPVKTAEQLAAITGHSVRTAAYQISGEHEPSARSLAAVIVEITKRN